MHSTKSMAEQVKNWYVIRAVSGEEKKVKEYLESEISRLNIRDYIPQVLIPTEKVYTIRNGKKVSIERSYLPGYVLIEALLVGEIAHVIKDVPGVLGFLGNQGEPVPLRPAEVQRILHKVDELADLKSEGYRFMREAVRDNGQREWIRPYQGDRFMEDVTSVALKRMIEPSPVIGYLTGHRERSMYGDVPYDLGFIMSNKWNMNALCSMGFDVKEMTFEERIPDEVSLLWIADPRDAFTPEEETVLQDYIDRGGNMVYMGEYRHRDAQNPFLTKMLGLELTPLIVGPDTRFKGALPRMDVIAAMPNPIAEEKMWQLKNTYTVAHEGAAGVEQVEDKGFEVFPVVTCDTMGMYWTELETTDFVDDTIKFNPAVGEVSKRFVTALGLNRKVGEKDQRIVIAGDADLLCNNNFMTRRNDRSLNHYLILGTCFWLSEGKAPLDVSRPMASDNVVRLTQTSEKAIRYGVSWAFPICVLGAAVYVWIRRRGR